jgi:hypothetical protein
VIFKDKLKNIKITGYPCNSNEYEVDSIEKQVLGPFEMEGWIKILKEKSRQATIWHALPAAAPSIIYCIPTSTFDLKFQPLLERQAKTLDNLTGIFNWALNIMKKVQYGVAQWLGEWWARQTGQKFDTTLEAVVDEANVCVDLIKSFVNSTTYPVRLVRKSNDDYIKNLMNEGISLKTVNTTTKRYYGPFGGGGFSEDYYFVNEEIKKREGDKYETLVKAARQFINQYQSFVKRIKESAKALYKSYKNVKDEETLNNFEKATAAVNKMIQEYKTNYMVSAREMTTCKHFLAVIVKGKTEAGKNSEQFINDILKPQMEAVEELKRNLQEAILITLKPAEITVTSTEVPIAVLPPKIFGGEHKGVESLAEITPERIFNEIRDFLFKLAPTLFILLLVVGAIFYLISPINLQNIQTGSEYIKWAIIGYFLLLVVTGIISAVRVIFGGP